MIFNRENTEWIDGKSSLILGQRPALFDSINRKHTELFKLYKKQKSIDWSEDEASLSQTREDFRTCSKEVYDLMIKNLAFQWELDSIASRSISVLLAPFITDSDFWLAVTKNSELENTHWLTYAEIVRLCIPDPQDVFKQVMENEKVLTRAQGIEGALLDLQKAGAEYTLGLVENNQELYNRVFLGITAIYILERMLFMDSFANTFGIVELNYFQGAGALVQKVMNDENYIHCKVWEYALKHEMSTRRGATAFAMCRDRIETMLEECLKNEYEWNSYVFSGGKRVVGYNELLANEWANWNAQDVYMLFGILPKFDMLVQNPLPFMDKWLNIDSIQNAQQEGDGTNYLLNSFINDILENEIFEFDLP